MPRIALIVAAFLLGLSSAQAGDTPSPAGAKVFFVNLKDGAVVTSPFKVEFGISGMELAPAGTATPNTGHHHLIIDEKITAADFDTAIPADDHHKHFGKGQTEATIELPKGTHTLQLLLGDGSHVPHKPPVMSEPIKITVE
jgi:hypothetical protein